MIRTAENGAYGVKYCAQKDALEPRKRLQPQTKLTRAGLVQGLPTQLSEEQLPSLQFLTDTCLAEPNATGALLQVSIAVYQRPFAAWLQVAVGMLRFALADDTESYTGISAMMSAAPATKLPPLENVKGMLFDIDGTMTDSDPIHFMT